MKKILFLIVFILGFVSIFLYPPTISSKGVPDTTRCYDSSQLHLPEGVRARIGKGTIISMQYSPDGNVLAVLSSVGIWIYDAHSGEERTLLAGHTGLITNMSFSPDSNLIASSGMDGTARIWDVTTGKQKHTLTVPRFRIGDVAFSEDGKTLASVSISAMSTRFLIGQADPYIQSRGIAGTSSDIELWDVATGSHKETIKTVDMGHNILFSPDGKTLASVNDKDISLWDTATGEHKRNLIGSKSKIRSMSFSPNGHAIASGGWLEIHVWDTAIDKPNKSVPYSYAKWKFKEDMSYVNSLSFSPDGKTLASGSDDKTIRLWDIATRKHKILKGHRNKINSITFSPDGKSLASTYSHGPIRVWDVASGKQKQTFTNQELNRKQAGHDLDPSNVTFSPDGQTLAIGNQDASILLWDANTGKHKQTLKRYSFLKKNTWKVTAVSFSPDGKTLASGATDNNIRLWDIETGKQKKFLEGHTKEVTTVSFSPYGKMLASGSKDNTVRLWDVESGLHKHILKGNTYQIHIVTFSPDGKTLASGSESVNNEKRTIHLWDVDSGTQNQVLQADSRTQGLVFSPDGKTLVSGSSNGKIRLWDAATGAQIKTLRSRDYDNVTSVVFSPGGKTLASASRDASITLWNAATGDKIKRLVGHSHTVNNVAFSPDGKTLASVSDGGTVLLWDFASIVDSMSELNQ